MIWLSSPPWARWILVGLVFVAVIFAEFRPPSTAGHPFATRTIASGEVVSAANTQIRQVPVGLLDAIPEGSVTSRTVEAGAPLTPADVAAGTRDVPEGWWVITLDVPVGARVGDRVRVVVVDTGLVVDGFVAASADPDPFANRGGGVAIPGDHAALVAGAAANGRVVVLVSTG